MANGPIEFRQYLRLWTRDDALAGTTPLRLPIGPGASELYAAPVLQYRYRTKSGMSDWISVPIVREGDDEPSDDSAPLVGP